ncbi:galactose-1-epimerase, partial [Yersinia enterocolitica]|nr:galactose-1-epimerase [Yersinia enterocolitica]
MLKNDAASSSSVDQLAPDGHPFELTELHNKTGMSVTLMDWGATWLSAILPLKGGEK